MASREELGEPVLGPVSTFGSVVPNLSSTTTGFASGAGGSETVLATGVAKVIAAGAQAMEAEQTLQNVYDGATRDRQFLHSRSNLSLAGTNLDPLPHPSQLEVNTEHIVWHLSHCHVGICGARHSRHTRLNLAFSVQQV
eukprot:GILJ01025151.1.p2 GENE.GILJ01025151.1~~GILJ01025151.1.p2  ORF type:complete len:139 (-),score=4.38 GILJ01025151.1:292-708(-)